METLLPVAPDPELQATLAVVPLRVTPTGIGGFVGINADPIGDVVGRRLHARVDVTVRADDLDNLPSAVADVSRAVLGASAAELRGQGILKVSLDETGESTVTGQGNNQLARRELGFTVLFEHLQLPEEGEGVIETVPLMIDAGSTEEGGRTLLSSRFMEGSLAWFEVFDDPLATQFGPSVWEYVDAERRIQQTSNIQGGSFDINPNKPGTYLVLRDRPGMTTPRDFVLGTELSSDDTDALGFVFRFMDVDNFYFMLLDDRRDYRMIGRKVDGAFQALEPAAVDPRPGFVPGEIRSVRLAVQGDAFRLHLDGELVLEAADATLPGPGRVGFMCRANTSAFFHRIDLVAL
ncbi:MAG TPA: hypothetical protein VFZ18_15405 [Longimicrobiaceae bacterium]